MKPAVTSPNHRKLTLSRPSPKAQVRRNPATVLLWFAALYGFVLFICVICISILTASSPRGGDLIFAIPLLAACGTTIFCTAAWSVLGPGDYVCRMSQAHRYAAFPTVGLVLGVAIAYSVHEAANINEFAVVAIACILGSVVVSVSSQLVFWIFRSLFGWQLVWKYSPLDTPFQLKDIFVVTALIAFCLAAPQIIASVLINMAGRDHVAEPQIPFEGSADMMTYDEQVIVYPWNKQRLYAAYGSISAFTFVSTLLSVPIMAWLIRPHHGQPKGCAPAAFYVMCGSSVFVLAPTGIFFIPLIGAYAATLAFPLCEAFNMGLRLTSPRHEAKQGDEEVS